MKKLKPVLLTFIIFIILLITASINAIPKDETALVDINRIYWQYKETRKEQQRLKELKSDMEKAISPLASNLSRTRNLINTGTYTKKVKYEYMREYFLLSSELQQLVDEYNSQLMRLEQEIRENLLADIWTSIETYSKLKDYKYVFKIGRDDVIAYDPELDITDDIVGFINTVPNASELEVQGSALVLKSNTRLITGGKTIPLPQGRFISILNDPENVLDPKSNGKKFSSDNNGYSVTVMYDGTIGVVDVEKITTNLKSYEIDLNLGTNYKTYVGFENYIKSVRNSDTQQYDLTVIKIPRLYVERPGASDKFNSMGITSTNVRGMKRLEISEIRDIEGDGKVEIVIFYEEDDDSSYLKFLHAEKDSRNDIDIKNVSPSRDFQVMNRSIPRTSNQRGLSLVTETNGGKYYSVTSKGFISFNQNQTEYWFKPNTNDNNPYRNIKPTNRILKYKFNSTTGKYEQDESEGPFYIKRGFTRSFAVVYKSPGDLEHISEIRKNDTYHIHSATSYQSQGEGYNHDLWFRIILEKEFASEEALTDAGFPKDPTSDMYNDYRKNPSNGRITIRFYAYIHGENLNVNSIIQYLGLPLEVNVF